MIDSLGRHAIGHILDMPVAMGRFERHHCDGRKLGLDPILSLCGPFRSSRLRRRCDAARIGLRRNRLGRSAVLQRESGRIAAGTRSGVGFVDRRAADRPKLGSAGERNGLGRRLWGSRGR